ncbi:MAG: MOSC domain-containing protein [Pseudomonadota bacterium]
MRTLAQLRATHARAGQVDWIGLRPSRRADMVAVDRAHLAPDGLVGDHSRPGKRAVTLIQAEHMPVIAALCAGHVTPAVLRRNLVVSGINLAALRDQPLRIGATVLVITGPCAPCSRMEDALGPGGYSAMRHHGGWCATVQVPGTLARGDPVHAAPDPTT